MNNLYLYCPSGLKEEDKGWYVIIVGYAILNVGVSKTIEIKKEAVHFPEKHSFLYDD